jgi:uncharacterized protein YegL
MTVVKGDKSILTIFNAAKLGSKPIHNIVTSSNAAQGGTPTGKVLKQVLDEHLTDLDEAIDKPRYAEIRPMDIIVLTDGRPGKPWKSWGRRNAQPFSRQSAGD